jgi:Coenzyme PQQ synthesis protein D (PqqD)
LNRILQALPKARDSQLITEQLPNELLVYDQVSDKAFCLNASAARIWSYCDGRTSVAEMTQLLAAETKAPVEDEVVQLALRQLTKSNLLDQPFIGAASVDRLSRRALVQRLGVAAAVTLPFIISITAPTAAQAASCVGTGGVCTTNSDCCSDSCVDNGRGGFECA